MFADLLPLYPPSNTTRNSNTYGNWSFKDYLGQQSAHSGQGALWTLPFPVWGCAGILFSGSPERCYARELNFSETMGACFILIVCIIRQNGSRMEGYFLKRRVLGPDIFKIQTARDSEQWREGCWWSFSE